MGNDRDYGERDGLFDRATWNVDIDRLLEQSQEEQTRWLRKELDRLDQQLEKRDEIHDRIVDRLEWKVDRYTDRLEKLYSQRKGKRDGKREQLKQRIQQFYDDLREEQRSHWEDRQQLEAERREILRELDRVTSDYLQ
ncbi:MAG: hypothetical protein SV186_02440 [Candidatus Nanohaloarchaea archaeon]|nr:hypothetical protein [Candidatus Nanohaloarchaea archaeon]